VAHVADAPHDPILRLDVDAHRVLVAVVGEIDLDTAVDLRRALLDAVTATSRRVVLDLSRLTWIDSFGLGLLVTARRRLRSTGGDLVIWRPSRKAAAILELSGVDLAIPVLPASVLDPFTDVADTAPPSGATGSLGSA
jgi:anti-sigma B factor antagonist